MENYPNKREDKCTRRQLVGNEFSQDNCLQETQGFGKHNQSESFQFNVTDFKFNNNVINRSRKSPMVAKSNPRRWESSFKEIENQAKKNEICRRDYKPSHYKDGNLIGHQRCETTLSVKNSAEALNPEDSDTSVQQGCSRSDWDYVFNDENIKTIRKVRLKRKVKDGFIEPIPDVDDPVEENECPRLQVIYDSPENLWCDVKPSGREWDIDK